MSLHFILKKKREAKSGCRVFACIDAVSGALALGSALADSWWMRGLSAYFKGAKGVLQSTLVAYKEHRHSEKLVLKRALDRPCMKFGVDPLVTGKFIERCAFAEISLMRDMTKQYF